MPAKVFEDGIVSLYCADCRGLLPSLEPADVVIADPPYGVTALEWDRHVSGWLPLLNLKPSGSLWHFGSFRFFLERAGDFTAFNLAQEIVWEKQNGSIFHNDRFRRVHELAAQFYRGGWRDIYRKPVYTLDARRRVVRRRQKPGHSGEIGESLYASEDGGPRLARSVLRVRSCHGKAIHPTEKPAELIDLLLRYSCPPGGLVVDPFAGSASTLVAARALGMRAVGIEISDRFCEAAQRRLAQRVLPVRAGNPSCDRSETRDQ